jgi:hypothetical protein
LLVWNRTSRNRANRTSRAVHDESRRRTGRQCSGANSPDRRSCDTRPRRAQISGCDDSREWATWPPRAAAAKFRLDDGRSLVGAVRSDPIAPRAPSVSRPIEQCDDGVRLGRKIEQRP